MLMRSIFPVRHKRSSAIVGLGHERRTLTLGVRWKSGNVSFHYGVPRELFGKFLGAESLGKFFRQHVRGKFVRQAGSVMVPFPCGVTPGPFSRGSAPPVQSEVSESYFSASQASKPEKSNARFNLK